MLLEAIFFAFEKNFSEFPSKIFVIPLHDIIGLQISHCHPAYHNPELRYVICTDVTLFTLVLHLNCAAISQSESSFFMCIIKRFKRTCTAIVLHIKLVVVAV